MKDAEEAPVPRLPPYLPIKGRWSEEDRVAVDAFVARWFGLRGSLRLHRNAAGWDLLRAPANVALAPVYLLVRLAALLFDLAGVRRAAEWLGSRHILLRSNVARAVGAAVTEELIKPRMPSESAPSPRQLRFVREYTEVRNAIAEICTTLVIIVIGLSVFRIVTPGVISLAPVVSNYAEHVQAIAAFPLGERLGGLWYWFFPPDPPLWQVLSAGLALALAASIVTTFSGVVTDPLQAALGLHRRRLLRLLTRVDRAENERTEVAKEHIVARLADLTDAGISVLRFFR